jgi:hypothetical protein
VKKHLLIISYFLLLGLNGFGQNKRPIKLGIGFVAVTNPYEFEDMYHSKQIFIDETLTKKFKIDSNNNIYPFFYKLDYGLYHFLCLEKNESYYKVLINDSAIAFIPNDSNFIFTTWNKILITASIGRLTSDNPIRETVNNTSDTLTTPCKYDNFKILDFAEKQGEYWIKVSFSTGCEDYPSKYSNWKYGWIKWRTKNELLIRISLLC